MYTLEVSKYIMIIQSTTIPTDGLIKNPSNSFHKRSYQVPLQFFCKAYIMYTENSPFQFRLFLICNYYPNICLQ